MASDNNGNIYIANHFYPGAPGDNAINKISCDGEIIDDNFIPASTATDHRRFNFASHNGILYEPQNARSGDDRFVGAWDLCTGDFIGKMSIDADPNFQIHNISWGFTVDDTNWYLMEYNRAGGGCIWSGTLDVSQYDATGTNSGAATSICIGESTNMGITTDAAGNFYVVTKQTNFGDQDDFEIRKYSPTGTLLATATDPTNAGAISTAGTPGFWGARGLAFSNLSNHLYVGNFENCVSVLDADLNEVSAFNIPNPAGGEAKAVAITTSCCPISSSQTINKSICSDEVVTEQNYFLNDLFGCDGPVCEGVWTEQENTSNGTIVFNDCNLSIDVDGIIGCATYQLISDGLGNKKCGAIDITMEVCIESCSCIAPTITTATSTEGTCSGATANDDATISLSAVMGDEANYSAGATYTGAAYGDASNVDVSGGSGMLTGLMHATEYTVRVFNAADDCFTDETITTPSINCVEPCPTPNCFGVSTSVNN